MTPPLLAERLFALLLRLTPRVDPMALVPAARRVLGELDPGVAMARAEPLAGLVARAGAGAAFAMALLMLASAVALALGLVGVYAVIALGVLGGLGAAVVGTRPLRALLFGVAWNDAPTYAAVAVGIFLVALLACWVPAARTARVEPMEALR